jgi:hypothetical protein
MSQLVRALEVVARDLPFGDEELKPRIRNLDALLFECKLLQVSTTCAAILLTVTTWLAVACLGLIRLRMLVVRKAKRAGECIQRARLLVELDAQLSLVVGALGFCDE